MKAIILAAGYATRLHPLTLSNPKPLLKIGGKPIIEHVLNDLASIQDLDEIFMVVNEEFTHKFHEWLENFSQLKPGLRVRIITNNSPSPSVKAGAIGSLHIVLTRELITDDIIVVAADNLFNQSLEGFVALAQQKNAPLVAVYDIRDIEKVKEYSSVEIDNSGKVILFKEKPRHPTNSTIGVALYYYPKSSLPLIQRYIDEGNELKNIGLLVQWMCGLTTFYAWPVPGIWYDIGTKEMLEEADRIMTKTLTNKV